MGKAITRLIDSRHQTAKKLLGPMADMVISPGNMDGGLSSIQEKSLGCIIKGGTSPIRELLDYGERPTQSGLVIMDTPGSDIFSLTAMAAGGAQMIAFTTGRGSPAGFPIVPVIKIATQTRLYRNMIDDMDLDAGCILTGTSIAQAGQSLIDTLGRVAGGESTKAERNANEMFAIHTLGPSF